MLRWRLDKKPGDADTLDNLRRLLAPALPKAAEPDENEGLSLFAPG